MSQAYAERVVAASIEAPQFPQNLSPTGTLPWQLGHVSADALMGVTVALPATGAVVVAAAVLVVAGPSFPASSVPVAFLSSLRPSPMALPSSGSLPGPKISNTMTR